MKKFGKTELRQARSAGRWLLWSSFLFSIFVNLLMLTGPLYMLQVYDRVLGSRSEETLVALTILVIALFGLMGLLDYARGRVLARFGARFQASLDPRVFNAVLTRAKQAAPGTPQATGLRDMATIQQLFASPAMLAIFDLPWTPLFLGAIFIFHPWLGWLSLAGGAILVVVAILNNFLTKRRMLTAQMADGAAQSFSEEVSRGTETVRAQGMADGVSDRWIRLREFALLQSIEASDWQGFFAAFTKSFRMLLQSMILGLGAYLVLQYEMTAGAIIAGSVMMGRALAPIEQSIGNWTLVQRSVAGWRALGELLETTPPAEDVMSLPRPAAHLKMTGVSVVVEKGGKPALLGVNLDVKPGTVLGVIGRSGSGKTTLARTMLGLVRPVQGEVRLGGATLDQYSASDLGGFIGYLPQEVILFTGTVEENIARMGTEIDPDEVVRAAKRARAHDLILNLPDGYRTPLDGRDIRLSGGQKQRIGLARALYGDPVMLILDEPNSALDHEGSEALNQAVAEFRGSDRAVILMTHRPTAIQECNRLAVIDGGRIQAEGPRDEIVKSMLKNSGDVQQTVGRSAPGTGPAPAAAAPAAKPPRKKPAAAATGGTPIGFSSVGGTIGGVFGSGQMAAPAPADKPRKSPDIVDKLARDAAKIGDAGAADGADNTNPVAGSPPPKPTGDDK